MGKFFKKILRFIFIVYLVNIISSAFLLGVLAFSVVKPSLKSSNISFREVIENEIPDEKFNDFIANTNSLIYVKGENISGRISERIYNFFRIPDFKDNVDLIDVNYYTNYFILKEKEAIRKAFDNFK